MPHTMTDTGKVARPGFDASMVPTMPAVAAITMLLPPANACAIASTSALRLARRSSATKGEISAIADMDHAQTESGRPFYRAPLTMTMAVGADQKCSAPGCLTLTF